MAGIMKSGGLNAKVMAMRGRLFEQDDYYSLAQNKTVRDAAAQIMSYPAYVEALKSLDMEDLHREPFEQKIVLSLAGDFIRLYGFISDFRARRYLSAFYLRNEINIIKFILRSIYDKRTVNYTQTEFYSLFGDKMNIEYSRLVNSNNVSEFIENLKGTEFYSVLSKKYAEDMPSLFELEAELDMYYYTHLVKLAKKNLDKVNLKAAAFINGTEIDLRNIMWIYRLKRYYKMNSAEIFTYLIPSYYQLSKESLVRMAEAKMTQDLNEEIDSSPYAYAFTDKDNIERGFYIAMNKTVKRACVLYPSSMVSATAYIYLKELEIKNIITLIEGIRYSLKPDEILGHIIEVN